MSRRIWSVEPTIPNLIAVLNRPLGIWTLDLDWADAITALALQFEVHSLPH